WAGVLLTAAIAVWVLVVLFSPTGRTYRMPRIVRTPAKLLLLLYLSVCLAFGFLFHALYQNEPDHFMLNAQVGGVRTWEAIKGHRNALARLDAAQGVLATTVAGLRTGEGRRLLDQFTQDVEDEVRTLFATALSLSIVGPPHLPPDDAFFRAF